MPRPPLHLRSRPLPLWPISHQRRSQKMILRTISIENDGSARIAADGPLTSRTFKGNSDNPLQTLLGNGWARRKILLDLRRADYFDSCALGWLLNCHRELSQNGGCMLLHSAPPKVIQ